jgi:hypothetical protein
VFIFIIKYNSLMDFGPHVVGLFSYEDFERWYFGLCWSLGLMIKMCYLERISFFLKDFFKSIFLHGEILELPSFFFCFKTFFKVNGKATITHRKDGDWNLLVTKHVMTKMFGHQRTNCGSRLIVFNS